MPQLDLTIMTLYFCITTLLIMACYFIFIIAFFKPTIYALKIVLKRFLQYLLFFFELIDTPRKLRSSKLYNNSIKLIKKWI